MGKSLAKAEHTRHTILWKLTAMKRSTNNTNTDYRLQSLCWALVFILVIAHFNAHLNTGSGSILIGYITYLPIVFIRQTNENKSQPMLYETTSLLSHQFSQVWLSTYKSCHINTCHICHISLHLSFLSLDLWGGSWLRGWPIATLWDRRRGA